ncbi:hypothetical protein A9Q99_25560 [Gammaproteobacteria bacterium 45_16_T64]|nr:hypothetical protein A9Q99_25560 [Gammaproteobacteria bacterium 45_16_T64]
MIIHTFASKPRFTTITHAAWKLALLLSAVCFFCAPFACIANTHSDTAKNPARDIANVDVANIDNIINLIPSVEYQESLETTEFDAIRALPNETWATRQPPYSSNFGRTNHALWFRATVTGLNTNDQPIYLRLNYPQHDKIDVYLVENEQLIKYYQAGDTRRFSVRPVDHRTYLFPFPKTPSPITVYLKLQSEGPLLIPLDIVEKSYVETAEKNLFLAAGIYLGILLIMFFYNAFIYVILRDSAYLLYILYVAATGFLQFSLSGFGFQYLWPESSDLNNKVMIFVATLMPLAAIGFVYQFLKIRSVGSRTDNFIGNFLLLCFGVLLIGGTLIPYGIAMSISNTLSFFTVIVGFYIGVKYWYLGVKSARMFAIAWLVYLVFLVWFLCDLVGIISSTTTGHYALAIGSAIELALLSLAFADRMNVEKELRIKAQIEVLNVQIELNKSLDHKVRERTDELEQVNKRLEEISITDALTQVFNRRHFDTLYKNEYQRAYRDKLPLALLMIDVDHFKSINDTHGHQFGDLCLEEIATCITDKIRRPPDIVARYGGEEFVVILPNTPKEGALLVAENIRQHLEETTVSDGYMSQSMTASIGLSVEIPSQLGGRESLLKFADTMLYDAKHGGRNTIRAIDVTSHVSSK